MKKSLVQFIFISSNNLKNLGNMGFSKCHLICLCVLILNISLKSIQGMPLDVEPRDYIDDNEISNEEVALDEVEDGLKVLADGLSEDADDEEIELEEELGDFGDEHLKGDPLDEENKELDEEEAELIDDDEKVVKEEGDDDEKIVEEEEKEDEKKDDEEEKIDDMENDDDDEEEAEENDAEAKDLEDDDEEDEKDEEIEGRPYGVDERIIDDEDIGGSLNGTEEPESWYSKIKRFFTG